MSSPFDNMTDKTTELASECIGRTVSIRTVDGSIQVDTRTGSVSTFGCTGTLFHIEPAPFALSLHVPSTCVCFRVHGTTNKFLTSVMYGDTPRIQYSEELAGVLPAGLLDVIPLVVDYAVGRATVESDVEGAGFNYSPITAQDGIQGYPTQQQLFHLEGIALNWQPEEPLPPRHSRNPIFLRPEEGRMIIRHSQPMYRRPCSRGQLKKVCVRSLWGGYWRSERRFHRVSQSPHQLGDTALYLEIMQNRV